MVQMQQAHYARQPQMMGQAQTGQRVMVQRVPYPPGNILYYFILHFKAMIAHR